jgi:Mg2+-importing ATPase
VASVLVIALGAWLPNSPIGPWLGFTALPALYWPALAAILLAYLALTQVAKSYLIRRKWI